MKVAITGGTGFVGGHLATALARDGHQVVVLARGVDRRPLAVEVLNLKGVVPATGGVADEGVLEQAFDGCDAVAHCAGINRELGDQTYAAVHVRGTQNVVRAAEHTCVRRVALLSFLRARPHCGSAYHETKWAAEEIVRGSSLEWTVLKPGMIYGRGDHMLDHLTRALCTFPMFVTPGRRRVRPLAVADVVATLKASLFQGRLPRKTVALTGPTELTFDDAVRLVARVVGKKPIVLRKPVAYSYALAWFAERLMTVPLISTSQVRILDEEVVAPVLAPDPLPADLTPATAFDAASITAGIPECIPFGLGDLRWFATRTMARRPQS